VRQNLLLARDLRFLLGEQDGKHGDQYMRNYCFLLCGFDEELSLVQLSGLTIKN